MRSTLLGTNQMHRLIIAIWLIGFTPHSARAAPNCFTQWFEGRLNISDQAEVSNAVRLIAESDQTAVEKIQAVSKLYFERRLLQLPAKKRAQVGSLLDQIRSEESMRPTAGGLIAAFDYRMRSIHIDDRITREMLLFHFLISHEFEHATQLKRGALFRNRLSRIVLLTLNPLPAASSIRHSMERQAMAAQWDFLQLFSDEQIRTTLKLYKKMGLPARLLPLLDSAKKLDRTAYIRVAMRASKYTYHRVLEEAVPKLAFYLTLYFVAGYIAGD